MNNLHIGRHISLLYRAQQGFFTQETKNFDIGGGQLSFLFTLFNNPGCSQEEMAGYLELDKTTVTRAATKLEKSGIIERTRDNQDLRMIRMQLTEKGVALQNELKNVAYDWRDILLEGMSERDIEELQRLITIMSENARIYKKECEHEKD